MNRMRTFTTKTRGKAPALPRVSGWCVIIAGAVLLMCSGQVTRGDFSTTQTSLDAAPVTETITADTSPIKLQLDMLADSLFVYGLEFSVGLLSLLLIAILIIAIKRCKIRRAMIDIHDNFRSLAENANEGIIVSQGKDMNIVFANSKSAEILGYDLEEFIKPPIAKLFHPDEFEKIHRYRKDRYKNPDSAPTFYQQRLLHKDGREIPVESSIAFTTWEGKKAVITSFRDISEHQRAEQVLASERDFAESLVDTAQAIVMMLDPEGKIVRFNPYMEEISGYSLDEVRGKDWFETFLPEEDHAKIRDVFLKAIGNIDTKGNVNPIITKDGTRREIEWYSRTLKDTAGNVTGLLSTGQDITDRLQADEKLRESEEMARAILNASPAAIVLLGKDGLVIDCNEAYPARFGQTSEQLIGTYVWDLFPLQIAQRRKAQIQAVFDTGKPFVGEDERNGTWNEYHIEPATWEPDGHVRTVIVEALDITPRKHAEQQLISQARFTSENPSPVMRIDEHGEILHANKPARTLLDNMGGFENPRLPESWKELINQALDTGKLQTVEYDCGESTYFLNFAPIVDSGYVNAYAHDITRRKQTERKVIEHQKKLRSLAQLLAQSEERQRRKIASGLHDNVVQNLAAVKISATMMRDSSKSKEFREEMEGMIRILDDTIYETRTLTFELCPPILHNLGFAAAVEWLLEQFGKNNKITTEFHSRADSAHCDMPADIRDLMFQLVREILTNIAKHAEATNVKVTTSNQNGGYVASIEDNGVGFDVTSIMSKSDGMDGFGLFNIRERLGHFEGRLDVDSKRGKGTKVTIRLPNQNDGELT
ncbi:MAG: PAS domain S-box protein [Phycisphaerae bacterium]|nr:PAS domain S-box protein [Phycisphaerae bacterium]